MKIYIFNRQNILEILFYNIFRFFKKKSFCFEINHFESYVKIEAKGFKSKIFLQFWKLVKKIYLPMRIFGVQYVEPEVILDNLKWNIPKFIPEKNDLFLLIW